MCTLAEMKKGKRLLGWFLAGLLSSILSSPAWGLDFDQSIQAQEVESAQLVGTLGRGKLADQMTSAETRKTVNVQLIRSRTAKRKKS
jgi:hypothetical protein